MSNKGKILIGDKSERVSFRLDADTARMMHALATEQGLVPSELFRQLVRGTWAARNVARDVMRQTLTDVAKKAVAERAADDENE